MTTAPESSAAPPAPNPQPARERLVEAAQRLYWAQGVDATTPREILQESGVGQGSLYHHFPTKHDLAQEALRRTTAATLDSARLTLAGEATASDRLREYLDRPRDALAGCKIGRLTSDPAVMEEPDLREPLATYFAGLLDLLTSALVEQGTDESDARDRAFTIVAVIQGGYVLSRALGNSEALDRALRGVRPLCGLAD